MIFNIHAGHNPDGKTACGAVGIVKESTEARAIAAKVIEKLRAAGHTVYECTVNDGTSQNDVLKKIVTKCNSHTVDLDVSIHLNSGRNDYAGDGSTGGTEVYIYNASSKAKSYAEGVVSCLSALGLRNRGVKTSNTLYVLKNTKASAMLIECFFVDDKDDITLYQKVGAAEGIANAIVTGLIGKSSNNTNTQTATTAAPSPTTPTENKVVMGVVTGTGVRIRKEPTTKSEIIGTVKNGQEVRIWSESNGWYMVDNNKWIYGKYIKLK